VEELKELTKMRLSSSHAAGAGAAPPPGPPAGANAAASATPSVSGTDVNVVTERKRGRRAKGSAEGGSGGSNGGVQQLSLQERLMLLNPEIMSPRAQSQPASPCSSFCSPPASPDASSLSASHFAEGSGGRGSSSATELRRRSHLRISSGDAFSADAPNSLQAPSAVAAGRAQQQQQQQSQAVETPLSTKGMIPTQVAEFALLTPKANAPSKGDALSPIKLWSPRWSIPTGAQTASESQPAPFHGMMEQEQKWQGPFFSGEEPSSYHEDGERAGGSNPVYSPKSIFSSGAALKGSQLHMDASFMLPPSHSAASARAARSSAPHRSHYMEGGLSLRKFASLATAREKNLSEVPN
jgi:hypothetical protein